MLTRAPAHPYTATLLSAVPVPDPSIPLRHAETQPTEPPSATKPPPGCRFHTRRPRAQARCRSEEPVVRELARGHFAACHYPLVGGEA